MPRPKTPLLTGRESEIMSVLWELGSATSHEIRKKLSGSTHDSTVRTLLRVLVAKGHVLTSSHTRPILYRPGVKRRSVQKKVTRDLLKRFFAGSAEDLVLHLLDDERLTPQQLKKLEAVHRRRSGKEK